MQIGLIGMRWNRALARDAKDLGDEPKTNILSHYGRLLNSRQYTMCVIIASYAYAVQSESISPGDCIHYVRINLRIIRALIRFRPSDAVLCA